MSKQDRSKRILGEIRGLNIGQEALSDLAWIGFLAKQRGFTELSKQIEESIAAADDRAQAIDKQIKELGKDPFEKRFVSLVSDHGEGKNNMEPKQDQNEEETLELTNEPGSIGEEQLPTGIEKTDKIAWDYTARKSMDADSLDARVHKKLKGQ